MNTEAMRQYFEPDGSPKILAEAPGGEGCAVSPGSAVFETVNGAKMEIILSEQIGATTWQVFRGMGGKVRVVIRQPTGYIETTARNIEVLLAKLVKLKIPYQPNDRNLPRDE